MHSTLTVMSASYDQKAITIAVSLLKRKNPQNIQTLKKLLTFIPNPNHIKDVLRIAVIELIYTYPQVVFWLFQHPEVLEPEIQVREVILQELMHQLLAWGYRPEDICLTKDHRLEISEAAKRSLLSRQPNAADAAPLTLIRDLLLQA